MNKRFKNLFLVTCVFSVSILVAACQSETPDSPSGSGTIEIGEAKISFTAGDEGFVAENTRATQALPENRTVDMGNGLTANICIEEDAAENTRAPKRLDGGGTFSIYAVDPLTHQRVMGTNGNRKLLKGKFVNGDFVPTGGALTLAPGTYQFVCINDDAITIDPVTFRLTYRNGKDAMVGLTGAQTITAADRNYSVHFKMRHLCARIRVKLMTYKQDISSIRLQFGSRVFGHDWAYEALADGSYSTTLQTTTHNYAYDYPLSAATANDAELGSEPFFATGNYLYILPGGINGKHNFLKFTSGQIYGKPIPNHEIYLSANGALPSTGWQGKSYTVRFALTPTTTPIYLFSDKTVGMLEDKGSRTPIALVYRGKTKTQQGIAMGLRGTVKEWEITTSPTYNGNNYTTAFATSDDALQDENGYNWTWTSSTDVDGLVKANQQTRYPAFYWASHDPYGVGFGEWYFPAIGEIINVFDKLAKKTNVSGINVTFEKQLKVIKDAFENAGGTNPLEYRSWSSTIYAYPGFSSPIVLYKNGGYDGYNIVVRPQGAQKSHLTRIQTYPFVRY